jgi:two-component system nitrate/nitrite response regulator NarL
MFAQAVSVTIERAGHAAVAVAPTADEALTAVREYEPDLVLIDIGLLAERGTVMGRALVDALPKTKVVAMTLVADERMERAALGAGLLGCLPKDVPTSTFVGALDRIARGEPVGAPLARHGSGNGAPARSPEQLLAARLSRREMQVLELIAAGASNRRIARRLGISPNTVRSHINAILSKLQLRSSLEAAAFAVRTGLVRAPVR